MTVPWGIFARVFPAGAPAEVAASIADAGYGLAQLNLRAVGLPTIPRPEDWDSIDADGIRAAFEAASVRCWGVSCSYNMAHPDFEVRRAGTVAAVELIRHAGAFGARHVTLCTGSRNAERMWAHHPDNGTPAAWRDMRGELDLLLGVASDARVVLAIEPEPGTVVRDADAASRLHAELGPDGPAIGIIVDAANLLTGVAREEHGRVLEDAFGSLAGSIVCLHAKDLVPWSETLDGNGIVDYDLVARLYAALPAAVPLIVQDVAASQAAAARTFLEARFGA